MESKISVIICTYNPVVEIFNVCLKSILLASEQHEPFEILIIDNNSKVAVDSIDEVVNFQLIKTQCRVILELEQGLTAARLRGIDEARGDLLVFIDDDNFISNSFFLKLYKIANENLHIGAFSGQVNLKFDKTPDEWTRRYWGLLVYRKFDVNVWSNIPHLDTTMPCGAGLVVRKVVADFYYHLHKNGKRQIVLDRSGSSLFSGGDNDLAACSCDLGFGVGLFHELVLEHFIPSFRLKKGYLLNLTEGITASSVVLRAFRNEIPLELSWKSKIASFLRMIVMTSLERQFYMATLKGEKTGRMLYEKFVK